MEPGTMLMVSAAIDTLKQLKQVFYDDRKNEAANKKAHEQVSLLAGQIESIKTAIEKHNDVLLNLTEAAQAATVALKRMKYLACSALLVSLVSVSVSAYLLLK